MRRTLLLLLLGLAVVCSCNGSDMLTIPGPLCPPDGLADPNGGPVTNPVKIEFGAAPIYPEEARIAQVAGMVILELSLSTEGLVCDIEVLREEPESFGFAASAIEAVEQWMYEPATQDGEPVAFYTTVFIEWVPISDQGTQGDVYPTAVVGTPIRSGEDK